MSGVLDEVLAGVVPLPVPPPASVLSVSTDDIESWAKVASVDDRVAVLEALMGTRGAEVVKQSERELIKREAVALADERSTPSDIRSSWSPLDMAAVTAAPETPEVGARSDGAAMFYKKKLNVVFGDSEGGKTWLCLFVAAQLLRDQRKVVYIDYEDGPQGVKQRLLSLGVPELHINDPALFVYLNPQSRLFDEDFERLNETFSDAELVVIDAFSEVESSRVVYDGPE